MSIRASSELDSLAAVLEYPGLDLPERVNRCIEQVEATDPDAAGPLRTFQAGLRGKPLSELEELYIQTFDMEPTTSLDLGWQLFGEDYNRGLFLVRLRQEMSRAGVEESRELPDHLTQVLRLIGRMEPDPARDFVRACVLPAAEKIVGALPEHCLYRSVLDTVGRLLSNRYAETPEEARSGAAL